MAIAASLRRRVSRRSRATARLAAPTAVLVIGLAAASVASALPFNVGHRGYSAAYPENTLVSIQASFGAGADITEIDLLKSSDGEVVIFHDDTLDRTTDGTGPVSAKTLAELQLLDAGSWFAPEFAGEPIPTLVEALALQQQLGAGPLLLDQKSGLTFGAEIAAALAATGASASEDIMVTAWTLAQVADIQAFLPDTLILWTAANTALPAGMTLADMQAAGVDGFSVIYESYAAAPTFIDQLHALGMYAYAWNADVLFPETVQKMQDAITMGLDGYIVNDPALFESILVPEPGSFLLLAGGLLALARSRRPVRRD